MHTLCIVQVNTVVNRVMFNSLLLLRYPPIEINSATSQRALSQMSTSIALLLSPENRQMYKRGRICSHGRRIDICTGAKVDRETFMAEAQYAR